MRKAKSPPHLRGCPSGLPLGTAYRWVDWKPCGFLEISPPFVCLFDSQKSLSRCSFSLGCTERGAFNLQELRSILGKLYLPEPQLGGNFQGRLAPNRLTQKACNRGNPPKNKLDPVEGSVAPRPVTSHLLPKHRRCTYTHVNPYRYVLIKFGHLNARQYFFFNSIHLLSDLHPGFL